MTHDDIVEKATSGRDWHAALTNSHGQVIFSCVRDTYVDHRHNTLHKVVDVNGNPVNVLSLKSLIDFSVKISPTDDHNIIFRRRNSRR